MGTRIHSALLLTLEDLFESAGPSLSLLLNLFLLISLLLILGIR